MVLHVLFIISLYKVFCLCVCVCVSNYRRDLWNRCLGQAKLYNKDHLHTNDNKAKTGVEKRSDLTLMRRFASRSQKSRNRNNSTSHLQKCNEEKKGVGCPSELRVEEPGEEGEDIILGRAVEEGARQTERKSNG